jgi:hypothetical protein
MLVFFFVIIENTPSLLLYLFIITNINIDVLYYSSPHFTSSSHLVTITTGRGLDFGASSAQSGPYSLSISHGGVVGRQ